MLTLDTSKVDLIGKEFLNKRDLRIEKQFGEVVALDDSLTFTVYITRKGSDEPFHGTLNQPLLLIASNTNIHINPVSTVIVNQGKATITLTPQAKGNVYIALNLGTAKI
ncbi:MAG: hypothetical protein LBP53_04650 [Candidatus Peribacteria bacterium]|jgi:hypothetical protein|nr:hypothetical protein [Candidatus Peribacteria bacterium]